MWIFLALALAAARAQALKEGDREWAFKVGGFVSWSSAAVGPDGRIYIGVSKDIGVGNSPGLLAVAPSGSDRDSWKIVLPADVESSPVFSADGRTVYVGTGEKDGRLYAYDTTTRQRKWVTQSFGLISSSPAIGADGTIYVGAFDFRLHAINPANGEERWSVATNNSIDLSSPAIATDGTIYFGSQDGNVYAVNPDGSWKWSQPYVTGGPILSSPAIGADGTIYIGSADQQLHAITPGGQRKWTFPTNGDIQASPVIGPDGTVYIASADTNFYALDPNAAREEDRVKWRTDIGVSAASTAAIRGDGALIFGADDGKVRALSGRDGSRLWTLAPPVGENDFIESSPLVAPDGSIYIGSTSGRLYKIKGNGSPLSQHSPWPAFRRDLMHTGRAAATNNGGQLVNIATRARVRGDDTLIAGFVVHDASEGHAYLVRAVGPGLAAQGVAEFQPDPAVELLAGSVPLRANDDWPAGLEEAFPALGAFPLTPGSKDAAILTGLKSGDFTALVRGTNGVGGVALVEVYDARGGDASARLVNLSTRGRAGTGDDVLIAGFVVTGAGSRRLLLRGVGPGLTQFGVAGALAQPRLEVFAGSKSVAANVGWTSTGFRHDLESAAASVMAFPLANGSADCALLFDASPGAYTIQISGVGGSSGVALVEIYVLP